MISVDITFDNPLWLWLALLGLPMAYLAIRDFRAAMSTYRAWSAAIARIVLIALIATILAGASSVRETRRLAVVAVVDISDSMRLFADQYSDFGTDSEGRARTYREAVLEFLRDSAQDRTPEDLLGVIVYSGNSLAVSIPSASSGSDLEIEYALADGSNIETALRFAERLFPPDASRRIVLISDGVQTGGDALAAASELASGPAPVRIDVAPVTYSVRSEVMVEAIDAPPRSSSGATVPVRVVLSATQPTTGTINLRYNGELVDLSPGRETNARSVTLRPGRNIEILQVPLAQFDVLHRMEVTFTPDDPQQDRVVQNNRAETVITTESRGTVLIVDGRAERNAQANPLLRTLDDADVPMRSVTPRELGRSLDEINAFDLIILQDVAAGDLPRRTHALLADYVNLMGGGLVMVGGYGGFGAGGWKGTDLEAVLPVELDLPDEVVTAQAAVCFIIDSSGSMAAPVNMGSRSQQEIANEGAAYAILSLDETDLVEVIEFNSLPNVVVPMGRNSNPQRSAARVRGISPGGGTNLTPAMRQGARSLLDAEASVKHMIILSDGVSQGSPEEMVAMAANLREAGVTVSTIAIGDGADTNTLNAIAVAGDGTFHPVTDPNTVQGIFLKEVQVVRRPLVREGQFSPIVTSGGSPLINGVVGWNQVLAGDSAIPPLGGLVLTQPKADPKITNALASDDGYPLLSHWFIGRGQVAAFTSDATEWAAQWRNWPGYAGLWTQIARLISRPAQDQDLEITADVVGDEIIVKVDAFDEDGRPRDGLFIEGSIDQPDGTRSPISLQQVGPGQYTARASAPNQGSYVVSLFPRRASDERVAGITVSAVRTLSPEFQSLRSNSTLLRQIAQVSGGRELDLLRPDQADLFDRTDVPIITASTPLWRMLLAWCVVVFLFDVGTRRLAWDRLLSRELALELKRHTAEAVTQRSEQAAATLSGLKGRAAKSRARTTPGQPTEAQPAMRQDRPAPAPAASQPAPSATDALRKAKAEKAGRRPTPASDPKPGSAPASSTTDQAPKPKPAAEQAPPASTTEGLMAAKRRAQRRTGGS